MHTTTWTGTTTKQDDTNHIVDEQLVTESEDELKVWAYVMTQYNLKPGLCKFGARGTTAAVDELTQLHIMDTWTAMGPSKISREERMRALSSLLFLKEKRTGKIKGRDASTEHRNEHTYPRRRRHRQQCQQNQRSLLHQSRYTSTGR